MNVKPHCFPKPVLYSCDIGQGKSRYCRGGRCEMRGLSILWAMSRDKESSSFTMLGDSESFPFGSVVFAILRAEPDDVWIFCIRA